MIDQTVTALLFQVRFVIYTDHKALENFDKVSEHHPRVQRWLELLNDHQYELVDPKGERNGNAEVSSRLPISATESNIHGDSALTHPDDVEVYFVGAPGL